MAQHSAMDGGNTADRPRSLLGMLAALIEPANRMRFGGLLLLSIVSSILESFGIVLVFSLFKIVVDPATITENARLDAIKNWSGATDQASFVALLCGALILLFLVKAVVQVVTLLYRQRVELAVRQHIGASLLAVYLRSPYALHLRRSSASLINNVVAGASICSTSAIAIADLVSDALLLVGVSGTLLWLQPLVTLATVLMFGLVGTAYLLIGHRHFQAWGRTAQQQNVAVYRALSESLVGVKQIKTLGAEGYFVRSYAAATLRAGALQLKNAVGQQSLKPIFEFIVMSCLLGPMIVLLLRGVPAAGLVPILGMFAAAAVRILPSLVRSTGIAQSLRFNTTVITTIWSDLHGSAALTEALQPRATGPAAPFAREFRLEQIGFRYEGAATPTLSGISLRIERGQSVAIVGASGAGKTTLVDIMLGLLAPSTGTLFVDERPLPPGQPLPRLFGYVPQDGFIIHDTIRRNIALGLPDEAIEEDRVEHAIRAASLGAFIASLPAGLDTVVGDRGVRLSGGQKQRMVIARALYDDPDILVLDEATSSLDPVTEAEVAGSIQLLRGRKTLVIIAHRLSTVKGCDRLFFLKAGRIAASGSFAELYARDADFRAMVTTMSAGLDAPALDDLARAEQAGCG
jgi:ABC-type multidrug transport system fused ATPase/permease subunit